MGIHSICSREPGNNRDFFPDVAVFTAEGMNWVVLLSQSCSFRLHKLWQMQLHQVTSLGFSARKLLQKP